MLTLTDAAGAYLSEILTERSCPEDVAIRFLCEGQGILMRLDNAKPGDISFEHEGRVVLLLDESTSELLGQETLDVEQTEAGDRLFLSKG